MKQENEQITDLNAFLERQEAKGLLRFITCGSVDDGKSTLIGRLLWESGLLYEDQIDALESESRHRRTGADGVDFSLLLDGLQAEREQGITIDVAYRFFSTGKRKFIVADTPGHEQYTRNMVTGASTADVAVILVDAERAITAGELLVQTKRHSFIASLMGIKDVVVAVNKMDLIEFSEASFSKIESWYRSYSRDLGFRDPTLIPVSALEGDNVITKSDRMAWFDGPSLLEYLETVKVDREDGRNTPFRMPVQWVNRPDRTFRGYSGTVVSGSVAPGDRLVAALSGIEARVDRIVCFDGDMNRASTPAAITLTLDRDIDVGRGDVFVAADNRPVVADQFRARLVWFHEDPLYPGRRYILKSNAFTSPVQITGLKEKVDVSTLARLPSKRLDMNEVGIGNLSVDRAFAFDRFDDIPAMGRFILEDHESNATVGAGMIEYPLRRAANIHRQATDINKKARAALKNQQAVCFWFTGLSGSGKSSIANALERKLWHRGKHTYLLDGDNVRHGLSKDLGFTPTDRVENIRRVAETARLMVDAGLIVICSFISPYRRERRMARELFEQGEFFEIFVNTPLEICESRDPKGLYSKAREGRLPNFTGIDSSYEMPEDAELTIDGHSESVDSFAERCLELLPI